MDKLEAEKIINLYGGAVAEGGIARKISLLPCNKSVIKYAFFTYLEAGISEGIMNEEFLQNLICSYSCLDHFIDDEKASVFNEVIRRVKNKQIDLTLEENKPLNAIYADFMNIITSNNALNEITEFIDVIKATYKLFT